MALNLLQQQSYCCSLTGKWTTPAATQRSVVRSRWWLGQSKAGETTGGVGLYARNLHLLKARDGLEGTRLPRARRNGKQLIPALRIKASEIIEEGEKEHPHRDDFNGTKFAEAILPSPITSPLQFQQPKQPQQQQQQQQQQQPQQLQPQRIRRAAGGRGGGGIRWILGPVALLVTGAFPALWLPSHTLFAGSITTGLLALAGLDSTFHMGATVFLLMADASARGKAQPRSPKSHSIPLGYKVWSFFMNLIGLLVPVAAVALSIKGRVSPSLEWLPAAALLGPYTLMLLVQCVAEAMVWHWHSPVWPVLPIVYQAYRLLQLTRGIELGASAAMNAPAWLVEGLLKGLVAWWVFVLGMQIMWVATLVGSMQQQEQWIIGH